MTSEVKFKPELDRFRLAKAEEIRVLENLSSKGNMPQPQTEKRPDFLAALSGGHQSRGLAVIAEYKRASPSLGDIELGLTPSEAARAYGLADCISVLTEETYFKGKLSFLEEMAGEKPLLRKDFIFHPLQVAATAATRASAILLIVRLTPSVIQLEKLIKMAQEYGLTTVVEIFDGQDLELARSAGARVIQVNARDLETLKVDVKSTIDFIRTHPPLLGEFWIAASGLSTAEDLAVASSYGYGAVLIGTVLMASGDPAKTLATLLSDFQSLL